MSMVSLTSLSLMTTGRVAWCRSRKVESCWYISAFSSAVQVSVTCSRVVRLNVHTVVLLELARKYVHFLQSVAEISSAKRFLSEVLEDEKNSSMFPKTDSNFRWSPILRIKECDGRNLVMWMDGRKNYNLDML